MSERPRSRPWIARQQPGFRSFKTEHPISYSGRWPRDALIQATLDASIHSIAEAKCDIPLAADVNLALSVTRDEGRELWLYCQSSHGERLAPEGFNRALCISRYQVVSPSRLLAARMIWTARSYPTDAANGLAIHQALVARGGKMTLSNLIEAIGGDAKHTGNCILSLVCNGYLAISDIEAPSTTSLVTLATNGFSKVSQHNSLHRQNNCNLNEFAKNQN